MCMYHIPLGILGEHMKRFTNHELEASDLKTLFCCVLPTSQPGY